MSDETYNGWSNRETEAVARWINNDPGRQESVHEALRERLGSGGHVPDYTVEFLAHDAGEIIRENVEETLQAIRDAIWEGGPGGRTVDDYENIRGDLGSLWRVNWDELGAAFLRDLSEDESGVAK